MSGKEMIVEIIAIMIMVVLCAFAPDTISMFFVIIMGIIIFLGVFIGVRSAILMAAGFAIGMRRIKECENVDIVDGQRWLRLRKIDRMFDNRILDGLFANYRTAVEQASRRSKQITPDIADYLNEDIIDIKMKHAVVAQIPGALTGIGILGTFVGLVFGVSSIAFSSVDVAIVSVTSVLSGIKIAFFTSICGVSLSLCFTFVYNWFYNRMLDRFYAFIEMFHSEVIPSTKEQMDDREMRFQETVLQYLGKYSEENNR